MDVIKKFDAAEEREDVNGMCEGLVSIKLQQTYSLNNEGQIKSIIMKKI